MIQWSPHEARDIAYALAAVENLSCTQQQCAWFPGLVISNAELFSDKIYGSDFIKRHSETVMV